MTVNSTSAQETGKPLTEEQRTIHVLSRFTLGATGELVRAVQKQGIDAWFTDQLEGRSRDGQELTSRLARLGSIGLDSREIMARYVRPTRRDAPQEKRREAQRLLGVPSQELRDSVLLRAVYGGNQVREVASDFFRNHFCVATDKARVKYFAVEFEREVIRPHVFGNFRDFLAASTKHPAMLEFLDNAVSRRAPSKAELKAIEMKARLKTGSKDRGLEASNIAAQRGLNENFARELLELHTLGVDNYYTQDDVVNVARVLTGWTIEKDYKKPLGFQFREDMHDRDDKRVLRKLIRHDNKDPQAEGEQLLDMLAAHKGTAHFMAWKLCRWLVRDDPPEDTVDRVAAVFKKTAGNLPSVYRSILEDPEFFAPENYRVKFKRPFEFVVSALRATHAEIESTKALHKVLASMNERIYLCKDPTGYYDQAEAWLDTGAFAARWKFARDLVENKLEGVRVPDALYSALGEFELGDWKREILRDVLPSGLGARTSAVLDQLTGEYLARVEDPRPRELGASIVSVVLGSPEFQQQ